MVAALTINIGAASIERARLLVRWLAAREEDVFLLTETSAGTGTAHLLEQFRRAGYTIVKTADVDGERGAALVSRIPLAGPPLLLDPISIPGRAAAAPLDTIPRTWFASVYVPSRDRSADKTTRKEMFISSLLKVLAGLPGQQRDHLIIGGDYNVITADHRPLHPGFLPFEFALLDELRAYGFIDAFEHCRPGVQEYSWIGRTGAGYRYDYFHVGRALADRISGCAYLHETREQGLTDHAAVQVDLDLDAARLPCDDPSGPETIELF
ncbi:endonuclease/exonuclease/phosphatase family protein [Nonomuraea roseoviolacea]|uniref:Exodeoxyribonuclease-3 n=1 Tax=Nonomuraea roseoviolacea subsp. carminata TaxID=160689 RepID=A0ABT1JV31_9ACTN|nr:endonuclease/exonuclease/phosphatase family protein [Nonomuraea roseoviolacea]MCP2345560.1 exodeoxyribonuclease-3 [Nonomuraea roseoviolacea subsp. carminata]